MPRKERSTKVYQIINTRPVYESEEEEDKIFTELAGEIVQLGYRFELEGKVPKGFVTGNKAV